MLKIQKSANGRFVVFALSGRIEAQHVPELHALFEAEDQGVMLDLKEVNLVDRRATDGATPRGLRPPQGWPGVCG